MIKLAGAFYARAGLSRSECIAHYVNCHGPLVRSTEAFSRHVARYTQHECLDAEVRVTPGDDAICGVTQLWFKDMASLRAAYAEPSYYERIRPDEHRFVHLSKALIVIGEETSPLPGGAEAPVRLFRFSRASASGDLEAAQSGSDNRARAVVGSRDLAPLLDGYTQTLTIVADNPFEGAPMCAVLDEYRFSHVSHIPLFVQHEHAISQNTSSAAHSGKAVDVATGYRKVI